MKILLDGIGGLGERLRFSTTFLVLEFSEVTSWLKFSAIYLFNYNMDDLVHPPSNPFTSSLATKFLMGRPFAEPRIVKT